MKKRIITVFLFTMIGFSCSDEFLEVLPTGSLSKSQLTTKAGLDGVLIAAYAQLSGLGNYAAGPSNWVWGSIRGGDANKGTDPGDFTEINPIQRFEYLSTLSFIADGYRGWIEGVARANSFLALLAEAKSDVTADDKKRMTAEARFLRGHYYFQLTRNFDKVPYVDETLNVGNGIEKTKNDKVLWPFVEADLKAAYDNLPETQSGAGRVNKWAAGAYLAKVYLFQKKFSEAKALFDLIIANGKTTNGKKYDLLPKFTDVFRILSDNNAESIFAVQATVKSGNGNNANSDLQLNFIQGNEPGTCCGFFQPSFELVNSYRTDANGLPLLDGSYNNDGIALKHDMGILSNAPFTLDAGNLDPRLDYTVGRRGIPYLDWGNHTGASMIRNQGNGGPYSTKKYVYYKSDKDAGLTETGGWGHQTYNALNITIIRFADVLLMAAEAEIEVGSLEKAREYVNKIRTRASNAAAFIQIGSAPAANYKIGLYNSPWTNKEDARKAVRFERKLELGMEGYRFYDLVRWGTAVTEINNYLKHDSKFLGGALSGAVYQEKHAILPIPQAQIDLVGKDILVQNPGY